MAYAKASRRSMADIINEAVCDWLDVADQAAPGPADPETFWTRAVKTDDCWLWQGTVDRSGYGRAHGPSYEVQSSLAHRIAWTLAGRPDPGELCILHHCDNPPCVRPDHLFAGTRADNTADMMAKGRQRSSDNPEHFTKGSRNGTAKLTEQSVVEMRQRAQRGEHYADLAGAFGVTPSRANAIILGNGWRHVWPYNEERATRPKRRR